MILSILLIENSMYENLVTLLLMQYNGALWISFDIAEHNSNPRYHRKRLFNNQ